MNEYKIKRYNDIRSGFEFRKFMNEISDQSYNLVR
jgi:hypothetical protein